MLVMPHPSLRSLFGAVLVCVAVGGCSAGDVQLNGKLFETIGGLAGSDVPAGDVKIAQRPGIVVPPGLQNLPTPGAHSVPDGDLAGLVDHDTKKVVDNSALQAKQAEYCKVNYEQAKQRGDTTSADLAVGPMGSCRPSAMGLIDTINGK